MDIVFAFTSSNNENFNIQQSVAEKMVNKYHISPTSVNVGAVSSAPFGPNRFFGLTDHTSKVSLMKALKSMPYAGSGTPYQAMNYILTRMFAGQSGIRKYAPKSTILFVDRNSVGNPSNLKDILQKFEDEGVNVLVVAIDDDGKLPLFFGNLDYRMDVIYIDRKTDDSKLLEIIKKSLRGSVIEICFMKPNLVYFFLACIVNSLSLTEKITRS